MPAVIKKFKKLFKKVNSCCELGKRKEKVNGIKQQQQQKKTKKEMCLLHITLNNKINIPKGHSRK